MRQRSPGRNRGHADDHHHEVENMITTPVAEPWVLRERDRIKDVLAVRAAWLAALGLSVPDHSDDLLRARAVGSVDRALRDVAA